MSTIAIFARANSNGQIITETECGAWTLRRNRTVEDDAGDLHPREGDGAEMVAELLSMQSDEVITADRVRAVWASTRA